MSNDLIKLSPRAVGMAALIGEYCKAICRHGLTSEPTITPSATSTFISLQPIRDNDKIVGYKREIQIDDTGVKISTYEDHTERTTGKLVLKSSREYKFGEYHALGDTLGALFLQENGELNVSIDVSQIIMSVHGQFIRRAAEMMDNNKSKTIAVTGHQFHLAAHKALTEADMLRAHKEAQKAREDAENVICRKMAEIYKPLLNILAIMVGCLGIEPLHHSMAKPFKKASYPNNVYIIEGDNSKDQNLARVEFQPEGVFLTKDNIASLLEGAPTILSMERADYYKMVWAEWRKARWSGLEIGYIGIFPNAMTIPYTPAALEQFLATTLVLSSYRGRENVEKLAEEFPKVTAEVSRDLMAYAAQNEDFKFARVSPWKRAAYLLGF